MGCVSCIPRDRRRKGDHWNSDEEHRKSRGLGFCRMYLGLGSNGGCEIWIFRGAIWTRPCTRFLGLAEVRLQVVEVLGLRLTFTAKI